MEGKEKSSPEEAAEVNDLIAEAQKSDEMSFKVRRK